MGLQPCQMFISTLRCIKLFGVTVWLLQLCLILHPLHSCVLLPPAAPKAAHWVKFPGLHAGSPSAHMGHPKKSGKLFLLLRVALFPMRFQLQREELLLSLDCAYHGKNLGWLLVLLVQDD